MVGIGETMGTRALSGRSFIEVLAKKLPLCNEDTSPVTPALIFRGVTFVMIYLEFFISEINFFGHTMPFRFF
ncbi:hypothetical protein HanPI659440_Chr13g0496861 [Helianthus annuus]|nr:hypothetical protein HanPI659440_Chr13g0496861 [Helianthus annuus]